MTAGARFFSGRPFARSPKKRFRCAKVHWSGPLPGPAQESPDGLMSCLTLQLRRSYVTKAREPVPQKELALLSGCCRLSV